MSRTITMQKNPLQSIKTRLFTLLLGVIFAASIGGLCGGRAYAADPKVLEAVDIRTLSGNRIQLRFQLSQPAERPRTFTINDPARLVLDFMDTKNGLSKRGQHINIGAVETLTVLEGGDRTRASINLARMVPYSMSTEGNDVLLTLEASGSTTSISVNSEGAGPLGPRQIGNIDFRRGPQEEAVIAIRMSDPSIPVDVRQEGTRIVADFVGAKVPRNQERRLDVTDFATPVTLIDVLNKGDNARVEIQPTGRFEFLAYQAEDLYTIEVRPVPEEPPVADTFRERKYTGEPLSLNFQDIEVRAVLQILADFTGLNVVVSDSVKGNLTLRLQNVPWDQALDIILRTKGLTQRQSGNVIYIAPTEEITAREKLELEAQKQVIDLVPLRTELIQVNYAKAQELATLIEITGAGSGENTRGASILSDRGKITADPRTNTLIVQDIPERISEIRDLVTQLDKPVRQVMIDSRIVVANDDFSKELGVRYGVNAAIDTSDEGLAALSGSLEGTDTLISGGGEPFPGGLPSLNDRLGVDLESATAPSRLALAILGTDYLVDLELSALQAEGRGEILSNPRIVTSDRKEATIEEGEQIPFATASDEGTNVEFKDAVLRMTVTPQITPDDRIVMDLTITQDSRGDLVQTATGPQSAIDKREIKTQVLVDNGETVVLGGVFIQETSRSVDKVPLLGDIPGIGRLFQRRTRNDNKRELLIFVTPQIVTEQGIAAR